MTEVSFSLVKFTDPVSRAEAATWPVRKRQEHINSMLIRYPLFNETVGAIRSFHYPVVGGTYDTGKIVGILGESRAGKSWAIKSYVQSLGEIQSETARVPRAVYVDMLGKTSSNDLASDLFRAIHLPRPRAGSIRMHLDRVVDEIRDHGIELVIIDDAQELLVSRSHKSIDEASGFILSAAESNACNVVLVGTEDISKAVLANAHMYRRGSFPRSIIQPYRWQIASERKSFSFLLTAIDDRLPFRRPSELADPSLAAHFYKVSGGLIGIIMNYVRDAAFMAMNENADQVTIEHLRRAAAMRRVPGDPYMPFQSTVDTEDPLGEQREADLDMLHGAIPTLNKTRKKDVVEA
jgi:hypothetical protein